MTATTDTAPTLRESVFAALTHSALAPRVQEAVVEAYAEKEASKRAAALIAGLDKLTGLEAQLKKISQPDQKLFDESGAEAQSYFTKGRLDEINGLKQKSEKLTKAINKATDDGDFGDLYNVAKDGGDGSKKAAE